MGTLVYIVDDEPHIRRLVSLGLKDAGFETQEFENGNALLSAISYRTPQAMVIDWMMPQPDGMELCKLLRADEKTRPIPILMLTARADEVDRVLGLEMGADDYITKPFSVKELVARVRAVLRRGDYMTTPEKLLKCGELTVDLEGRRVTGEEGPVELTLKEFDLLVMLMKNQGRVLTRDTLLDQVWGVEYFGDARTVDVHVRYLRQKIEPPGDHPKYIQTLRGVGYRFATEEDLLK